MEIALFITVLMFALGRLWWVTRPSDKPLPKPKRVAEKAIVNKRDINNMCRKAYQEGIEDAFKHLRGCEMQKLPDGTVLFMRGKQVVGKLDWHNAEVVMFEIAAPKPATHTKEEWEYQHVYTDEDIPIQYR